MLDFIWVYLGNYAYQFIVQDLLANTIIPVNAFHAS